jgi:tRNA threonylcarbamoyladenosine biosynthesis protein TsaB
MSNILHIETSTKACSVAIAEGGHLLASDFRLFDHYAHAETLNPMIQSVMKVAKRNFKDLEAIAVSSGPGSYTGLRIGISSAKGFCYGLEIPLIAVSSLEIMAAAGKNYEGKHENAVLVAMMDARRMEVYSATFDKDLKRLDNDKAIIVDENFTKRFEGEKIYYFGDGMPKCISVLEQDSRSVFIDAIYPDAKNMIQISLEKFRNSEFEDLAYFEPEYLKEFNSHL